MRASDKTPDAGSPANSKVGDNSDNNSIQVDSDELDEFKVVKSSSEYDGDKTSRESSEEGHDDQRGILQTIPDYACEKP